MRKNYVKLPLLIAALYFGSDLHAQSTQDTTAKENKIEEVVVIGYGTQKKENVTGSIAVISGKNLENRPNTNPLSSVQGRVSGVNITNSGAPGGSPRVDIRGVATLNGSAIFIVDGILTDDISFLNPLDIESMSILKDPSSLAIFGSRASRGAVVIKTKGGKGRKTVFNLNSYYGVKNATNIPKMVNRDQYIELYNEKNPTAQISAANYPANTNWFDEILKKGYIASNDISASGSTDKVNYFLSLGYLTDEGLLNAGKNINSGNDFNRLSTRVNVTYKLTDKLTLGTNSSWANIRTNNSQTPFLTAYLSPPLYNPINPDGTYGNQTLVSLANPRATLDQFRSKGEQNRYLINLWGEYKILDDLTYKINYTQDNTSTRTFEYNGFSNYNPASISPSKLLIRNYNLRNFVIDNTLTWKHSFGEHNFEVLGGVSRQEVLMRQIESSGQDVNYINDAALSLNAATNLKIEDKGNRSRIQSYFARLNYDFAGRYLLNASIRRDGSTGFDQDNRNNWFPAVSAGWVVTKESFMSNQNVFDLIKLRAGWGSLGNPDVPRSYTKAVNNVGGVYFGGIGYPSITSTDIIDTTIGWEKIEGFDYSVELALLNNKLKIEATYFDKDSKEVVYPISQPTISGATNKLVTNALSFNNKGFEFSVNYSTNITERIKLGFFGNLTTLNNEILSVANGSFNETGPFLFGETITRIQAGVPVGSYYGFEVGGIFQNQAQVDAAPQQNGKQIGGFIFKDLNGDGIIDNKDKTFLGSPIPDYTYGFGINLEAYNFDLSVDFQGVQGNEIYNYNREQRYGNESWDLDFYNNRWRGEGTSNNYPKVTNDQAVIKPNSFYVEDGSFFRIRNIQLGYTVPSSMTNALNIQKLRVYFSAQNPWTSFKYNGFSPEILSTDIVQSGVDNNIYPLSAIYTVGLNLTF